MNNPGKFLSAAVAAAVLQLTVPAARAVDNTFTITPYLWVLGIDGDINVNGENISVSSDFSDIVDNLDFGGSMLLEADRGNWVSYAIIDYLNVDSGDVDTRFPNRNARLELESWLATVATGYRFQLGEHATIDVQAGIRHASMDTNLSVRGAPIQGGRERNSDTSIYDGIVSLRPRIGLSAHWTFSPTLSIGAGDSDLTWEVSPEFVYQYAESFELRVGYRNLDYDFEEDDDALDLSIKGPMIGVGYTF